MASLISELRRYEPLVRSIVCSTGQHRTMLEDVYRIFNIHPDIELEVMQHNQHLSSLTSKLLELLDQTVKETRPDWIISQGDTTTVLASALTAYYNRIPFGHVEAGLRTGNRSSPFPEEINRRVADDIADLMFAPTEVARERLLSEGHNPAQILVTGNTVIDALHMAVKMPYIWEKGPLSEIPLSKRIVLVTAHRRESFGGPLRDICMAIRELADRLARDDVHFVYPVHLNPNVYKPVHDILGSLRNITLLPPLDYLSFVNLLKNSTLVLTDSGGVQEEAPGFGKPVLVMRNETERPEGVQAGVARLVGTSKAAIVETTFRLLTDSDVYDEMAHATNPYGDGKAARRIAEAVCGAHSAATTYGNSEAFSTRAGETGDCVST